MNELTNNEYCNKSRSCHTFQIFTLGCKVNQYESEQISQALTELNFVRISHVVSERTTNLTTGFDIENQPEWIIVNTCAVTQESEAKSRKLIRQMIKRHQPQNVLVFGCSAENDIQQYLAIPGVTHVITGKTHGGNRVAAVIEAILERTHFGHREEVQNIWQHSLQNGLRRFGERHRAYVKVQDGCKQFCTYCLIPHLRNRLMSVPIREIQEEVRTLLLHGYKEIVLTGIHLGYYGLNENSRSLPIWMEAKQGTHRKENLTQLMETLVHADYFMNGEPVPEYRLRLSSLEAHEAGDELLHLMAENRERVCPHLHLSMQSASPTVHHRMNRPGTVEQYVERCEAAKKILDNPALTTDIIVGFPGETEREFLETCDVVRHIGFSKIHIFPFSVRPGTPAEKMGNLVPTEEKHRREIYLAKIENEMREKFIQSLSGRKQQYLAERFHPQNGTVSGTSEYYLHAEIPGTHDDVGTFVIY